MIVDWKMPNMDGIELCGWVRQQEWASDVYILFLTARTDVDAIVEALSAGADAVPPQGKYAPSSRTKGETGHSKGTESPPSALDSPFSPPFFPANRARFITDSKDGQTMKDESGRDRQEAARNGMNYRVHPTEVFLLPGGN